VRQKQKKTNSKLVVLYQETLTGPFLDHNHSVMSFSDITDTFMTAELYQIIVSQVNMVE